MIDHFCFEGDFRRECHRSGLLTLMYNFSDIILSANYRLSNYKAYGAPLFGINQKLKLVFVFAV